jgi:predicted histone-like DNA-binding protein
MSISYRPVRRKNPRDLQAPAKYYPNPVYVGKLSAREIAKLITETTSFSPSDTIGIIQALIDTLPRFLEEGYIIQLGDFGTFRLTFEGAGAGRPEEVSAKNIKALRYNFLPGQGLTENLKSLHPEKEKKKKKTSQG